MANKNMKPKVKAMLMSPKFTIKQAMETIEKAKYFPDAPAHIALVVDQDNKLIGTVTDGDVRRALLAGSNLDEVVEKIMNPHPITFSKDLSASEIVEETIKKVKERGVPNKRLEIIITVDQDNKPYDVFNFFDIWR